MEFWNQKLKTSDILIFVGNIKDRYLSSDGKWFLIEVFLIIMFQL